MRLTAAVVTILVMSISVWAAADPFVGTWKLNKAKSQMGSSNFQSRTFIVTGTANAYHVVQKDVLADGTPRDAERNEMLDGKEHPAQDGDVVVGKLVNAHTKTFTWTKDGKRTRTATDTITADGKTFTHDVMDLVQNEHRVWVFERQ